MSIEKQAERNALLEKYKSLSDEYTLMEMFKDFWTMNEPEGAIASLAFWCNLADNSNLPSSTKASKTMRIIGRELQITPRVRSAMTY